jgi:hypothetical protein
MDKQHGGGLSSSGPGNWRGGRELGAKTRVGDGGQTVGPFIAPGAGRRGSAWAVVRRQRNGEQWRQRFQLASEVTRTRKIRETGA